MNVLLKSAKIVHETRKDLHLKKRDILIRNGYIENISSRITPPAKCKVISLDNLHVSIGWFDSGVSFGEPGYEERETIANGLKTASYSGFTDLVLNPNTFPVPDTNSHIVFLKNAASGNAVQLYPLACLTQNAKGAELAELFDMKNAGAVGFYDFKKAVENPNLLKIALQYTQGFEGCVFSFPTDLQIQGKGIVNEGTVATKLGLKGIPAFAEELRVSRDLDVLAYTGGKLHIPTISTAGSVKRIAAAKKKGLDVSTSVAIHNLFFDDTVLEEFDTNYKVMPALRLKKDQQALIKGIKDGSIDFVTTDHIPLDTEEKRMEFDNAAYGSLGLESAFGALNKVVGMETAVQLLTKGRTRFNIENPILKQGERACLTLFDPDISYAFTKEHLHSTSKNSMFLNQELKGKVYGIIANNQIVL